MNLKIFLRPTIWKISLGLFLFITYIIVHFATQSEFIHVLGVPALPSLLFFSLDFFPLFPWVVCIFFGVRLGHFFLHAKRRSRVEHCGQKSRTLHTLAGIGRYSLPIYIFHVPLLLMLFHLL